ncbi:MAG: glycoside hydrolase family 31 protein [Prolixibacteraceae bacterium]|jgi:alpha-glucosidase|nr:glycoside hydrolase family 31 protein [Prolixibacteraceae bacterium]
MTNRILTGFLLILFVTNLSFAQTQDPSGKIILENGEKVWAGVINDGHLMPFQGNYAMDFSDDNKYNQLQPLILTSKGQYVWSDQPFKFEVRNDKIIITDPNNDVITGKSGTTLAEVRRFVSKKYFPASGLLPDTMLFAAPQYNTWIELNYHQSQAAILKYAKAIIANGLPAGVLMLDDTWQEDYGLWDFHPRRFPNPKDMMDQLHKMGFKVMLWICPFVSPDQTLIYNQLSSEKAFLLEKAKPTDTWESVVNPVMIRWWDGVSAELDFSNPAAVKWFNSQLDRLVKDCKVDGFKFDAGDMLFYPPNALSRGKITPNQHCELYAQFGLRFPLNEYRACWKMGGQPLGQRLTDKKHTWEDLQALIPNMIVEGLSGYTFSCPDLIGGGLLASFENPESINQDLIVRSAQCHALMPMMQFSVAPWRILDLQHFEAVKKCVQSRMKFTPMIMKLVRESAITGDPILRNMEFVFPNQGYETINDQFMMGDNLLVAPVVQPGTNGRSVVLPKGTWKSDVGIVYKGGKSIFIDVPLERLPYFEKVK